jgi:hypothetical protein
MLLHFAHALLRDPKFGFEWGENKKVFVPLIESHLTKTFLFSLPLLRANPGP